MNPKKMSPIAFFKHLYGENALDELDCYLAITLLDPKNKGGGGLTYRFKSWAAAAEFAMTKREDYQVYYNLGLHKQDLGTKVRGKWRNLRAHFGVYFDMDINTEDSVHAKKNLPESPEEALRIFAEAFPGIEPALVLHSGYGLHIYVKLHRLVTLDTDDIAMQHQYLIVRSHQHLKNTMAKYGFSNDSVYDLPRILRPPMTFNHKVAGKPKETFVYQSSNETYEAQDISEMCPAWADCPGNFTSVTDMEKELGIAPRNRQAKLTFNKGEVVGNNETSEGESTATTETGVKIDLNVIRPDSLIIAMCENSDTFARDFHRKDIKKRKDSSASSYDLGIANACINAGLTDQQTVDILIVFRRENYKKSDPDWGKKLLRGDYVAGTLRRAKNQFESDAAKAQIQASQIVDAKGDIDKIATNLGIISKALGVEIEEVIKYQGETCQYDIVTKDNGTIRFASTEKLITFRMFKIAVADKIGVVIPGMKADKWEPIAQAILNCAIIKQMCGADTGSMVADYIRICFSRSNSLHAWKTANASKTPFVKGKDHFIFCDGLYDAMRMDGRIVPMAEIAASLARLGCVNQRRNFAGSTDGHRQQAWVWRVPKEIVNGKECSLSEMEDFNEEAD